MNNDSDVVKLRELGIGLSLDANERKRGGIYVKRQG